MSTSRFRTRFLAGGFLLVSAAMPAWADDPKAQPTKPAPDAAKADNEADVPVVNLLDAMRDGLVDVQAEGRGDGRMTVSVTNKSKRQLNVVLPPGLIAQGAAGQMGGMGGMGGGMGGMGGMGGGMGGMGGGMGGMGGGMGGMGGGMGGGMMGGRGGMSGTMPPMMGMMMLARLIMSLCGDYDSWDQRSLATGMMGGMGGMGMGGGMGGMGGMGGGMGGMGMGMRSVAPTGLPYASLKPGQNRKLPTRLVSLSAPNEDGTVRLPAEGEQLQLGDVSQINADARVQKALRRLAAEKAPESISQLVMWRLAQGLDWDVIARMAEKRGKNYEYELTLAQEFVDRLATLPDDETGVLLFQVDAKGPESQAAADELTKALKDKPVLGLWAREGVPAEPEGPAVACRIRVDGKEALVQVASSNSTAQAWVPFGKFTLPVTESDGKFDAKATADELAGGVLNRLVRAQLSQGPRSKGKPTYQVKIENASPLVLNGLAIAGADDPSSEPKELSGVSIGPRRSMTFPATDEVVKGLGLKKGIRISAADLSGL
ncbi:hypothetical protein [Paludisphaera rhizosphaerae]|uniref:hypothetical protein n=1 Tax=Paludisphaera rhizosphaerae TaxID=2711216 RepID=UPI0013EAAC38|nr:hypothetical protein [Paludisphaera rhizosphaerae]